jgi:hypothetical protein
MKRLVVFLLLLACALCAVAETRVSRTGPTPDATTGSGHTALTVTGTPATLANKADAGLFATASGALASLLFVWSPFGAAARRRLGSRAQLSALILALLLCSIMAVDGCSGASSALAITAIPAHPAS